ncbi:hypothetical protein BGZ46_001613 [Entomortierella lignicola]|nr:hypothetical protein BGZ46_001613 [Entomortierella lignicola]
MSSKELNAFLVWAEENEILWDKTEVEIKEGKHGLGIFAKKHLEAGYEVVKVPKAIVLSVETTGIANLLADEEIEGYIGLTMGCMYEWSCGKNSPWFPYLSLISKRPPQMATSLSKDAREKLKYCEAYNDIESDIKDMQDDYDSILIPFIEKYPEVFTKDIKEKFFSFEAFKTMTAHVSSRSMDVDNFHVSALVPFADFVNHSPTPNADYLTHEDVCEVCGALACEHLNDEDDDDSDDDGDEAPELLGEDNEDEDDEDEPAPKRSKKNNTEDDEDEEVEWEDEDEDDDEDDDEDGMINDTCDIILDDDVEKGQEITRHYGPYPNKIILSKYGFAVEDNPHDTVTIQLDMVRQAASKFIKDEKLVEERIQWFLENEDVFIGAEDEDEHEHGDGCCGGDDEDHGHSHDDEYLEDHEHSQNGGCCDSKKSKKASDSTADKEEHDEESEMDEEDEEEEEEDEDEEDDFPRDIMYMMHDGSIDDRLFLVLNVLFMEKDQFQKVTEDADLAMEYFGEIFFRRQQEEQGDEEDEDEDEEDEEESREKIPKPEMKPRDAKSKKVRKAVLEAILELVRIRADTFGVSNKTTAEQDLASLKKAKLSGPLYYGGLCVQGEKQILQNGLQGYQQFLSEL